MRVIIALIILLPIMYFATRLYGRRIQGGTRSSGLHVVAITSLGQGRNVYVVRVAERYLVLGVTPQHITVLTELSAAEAPPEWLAESTERGRSYRAAFEKTLAKQLNDAKIEQESEDNQHE